MDFLTLLLNRDRLVLVTRQGVRFILQLEDCLSRCDVSAWLAECIHSIPNAPRRYVLGNSHEESLLWLRQLANSACASVENKGAVLEGLFDVMELPSSKKPLPVDVYGLMYLVPEEGRR